MMQKITYYDLEQVLFGFGFSKHENNGHVRYEDVQSGAIIALPNLSPDTPVYPHHYLYARSEVDGMGIADKERFEKEMRERGELPAGITTVV
jgi:hypothetical protein